MQQNEKTGIRHLSKFSQFFLLDDRAQLLASCDSIVATQHLPQRPVTDWFPFLESIFQQVKSLQVDTAEIHFQKITIPHHQLPGIYDFSFRRIQLREGAFLLWRIFDYTALYEDLQHYQQRRNELEIHREMLELRQRQMRSRRDLNDGFNLVLENFNHLQIAYFNHLRRALQSPVNMLDGFRPEVTLQAANATQYYIQHLSQLLQHLQSAMAEWQSYAPATALVEASHFSPAALVQQLGINFREQLGQPLAIQFASVLPERLQGDQGGLWQILAMLLYSAAAYHPDSSFELEIRAQVAGEVAHLTVIVRESLGREQSKARSDQDDLQLVTRLSLARQMVEWQGGQIRVSNDAKQLAIAIELNLNYRFA